MAAIPITEDCMNNDSSDNLEPTPTEAELDELTKELVTALDEQTFRELAALSPVDYDRQREDKAKILKIRVSTLDAEVQKRRPKAESVKNGEGQTIVLSDPEPWQDVVNLGKLLNSIVTVIRRYVIVSESAIVAIALWILHTYCHESADISPVLTINSPEKRCGKTNLLKLLAALCVRPLPASNVTAATIFRSVEAFHPTLLIDESDTFINGEAGELRGILNSGQD